jgi:hypothetical protein
MRNGFGWLKRLVCATGVLLFLGSPIEAEEGGATSVVQEETLGQAEVLDWINLKKAQVRSAASQILEPELTEVEKDWGIKLYGVRWTAAGYMLEMKFRVLDEHKAFPLLKRDISRYLIVEKNGSVLEVPFTQKLGSLRSSVRSANMVKKDHNYVALFANPGKHVKPGDKVTLVLGNFILDNLAVK